MHSVYLVNIIGGVSEMTKWYDDQHKYRQDPGTPIVAGAADWYGEPQREYYCEYCQRRLMKLQNNTGNFSYYCNTCSITTNPDEREMRSKGKLQTAEGPPDTPLASTKFKEPTISRKPVEPKGAFAALRARGIRIKNYNEHGWRKEKDNG
jgi:hypothetical protein